MNNLLKSRSRRRSRSEISIVPGLDILGRYTLEEPFGFGGTAMVWRGHTHLTHQQVAIKIPHRRRQAPTQHEERLTRECQILSRICSPYVVSIHDFGPLDDGRPVAVFEYMEGQTLRDLMKDHQVFEPIEALSISRELVRALMDVHACGVVHRDIKPDNIMIEEFNQATSNNRVKLFDFGISKMIGDNFDGISAHDDPEVAELFQPLTAAEMTVGTPEYMAPEQISASDLGAFTDLYAVGIVLHEMLFGVVPYTGKTFFEIAHRHLEGVLPPLPADLPQNLQELIWRALACDIYQRYSTAEEMFDALETTLRHFENAGSLYVPAEQRDAGPWASPLDELPEPIYAAAYGEGHEKLEELETSDPRDSADLVAVVDQSNPEAVTPNELALPYPKTQSPPCSPQTGPMLDQLEHLDIKSTRQHWMPWSVDCRERDAQNVVSVAEMALGMDESGDSFDQNDFDEDAPTLVHQCTFDTIDEDTDSATVEVSVHHHWSHKLKNTKKTTPYKGVTFKT